MIIVSQDKEEIVNFDKVESIWICSDEEGRFTIEATAHTNATLGTYDTEERAKEILQDIWEFYETVERYKSSNGMAIVFEKSYVYEIPKE